MALSLYLLLTLKIPTYSEKQKAPEQQKNHEESGSPTRLRNSAGHGIADARIKYNSLLFTVACGCQCRTQQNV